MTTWDSTIFATSAAVDLLAEVDALGDLDEAAGALTDACRIGADSDDPDEADAALAAATIAAIWCRAPFSDVDTADKYPFIREGIGTCPEDLREAAAEAFEALEEQLSEENAEAVAEFAEAVN